MNIALSKTDCVMDAGIMSLVMLFLPAKMYRELVGVGGGGGGMVAGWQKSFTFP